MLRGPQGTLFGRNASAGAVLISSHAPDLDTFSGEVFGEVGNFSAWRLRAIVNIPVSDTFALRFAALTDQSDGYYHNLLDGRDYGDRDATVGRISARWQPNDGFDWTVRFDYAEMGGDGLRPPEVSTNSSPPKLVQILGSIFGPLSPDIGDPFDGTVSQKVVGDLDDTQWGITSDMHWDMESAYRIRWIGAYRSWENAQLDGDVIYTGLDLIQRRGFFDSSYTTQEIQLISPQGALLGGRMDFVAGAYYFDEDYKLGENLDFGTAFCPALMPPPLVPVCLSFPQRDATVLSFKQNAESKAVYLETNFKLTDSLQLKLGGRYTKDDKSADFLQILNNPIGAALRAPEEGVYDFSDNRFTFRAVLSWYLNDDTMLFGNYSTGYKSGGINSSGVSKALTGRRLFDSETVDDIELGIKSTVFHGAMQLNATAYRMDIDDFQDRTFRDASFLVINAGSLRQQGVELEIKAAPTADLRIDFAVAYLDSEFTDLRNATPLPGCAVLPPPGTPECPNPQDNTGKRNAFSPKWEMTAGAEYVLNFSNGMSLTSRIDWQYMDDYLAAGTELNPQARVDAYNIFGARMTLASTSGVWLLSLYGQNLTDERYPVLYFTQVLGGALGLLDTTTGETVMRHFLSAPRTYGLSLTYRF